MRFDSQQKRIKLANHFDHGWAVVDKYENDKLVSDEDNMKKIEKAEKAMAAKALKLKKALNPHNNRQVQGCQLGAWGQLLTQDQRERYPPRVDWSRSATLTNRVGVITFRK